MRFADPAEAEAFLATHPEVRLVELFLIDSNGVPRGKLLHRDELLAIYRDGRPLPSTILGLTINGEDVEETGLVWEVGDADCWSYPLAVSPPAKCRSACIPSRAARPATPTRATCWLGSSRRCRLTAISQ